MKMAQAHLYQGHEIAFLSGVTKAKVDRYVDQGYLAPAKASKPRIRLFNADAAVLVRVAEETGHHFVPKFRKIVFERVHEQLNNRGGIVLIKLESTQVQVKIAEFKMWVKKREKVLRSALRQISSCEGVMNGEPVVKGTRVPVRLIADLLNSGESTEAILRMYPHLEPEQIEACRIYDQVIPRRGRPKSKRPGRSILKKTYMAV